MNTVINLAKSISQLYASKAGEAPSMRDLCGDDAGCLEEADAHTSALQDALDGSWGIDNQSFDTPDAGGTADTIIEDTLIAPEPGTPNTANSFALANTTESIGFAPCDDTTFVANITHDPLGGIVGICADPSNNRSTIWTAHSVVDTWAITAQADVLDVLDEAIVNPHNPDELYIVRQGTDSKSWGWKRIDRTGAYFGTDYDFGLWTSEEGMTYSATYLKGIAFSSAGHLAIGASNLFTDAPSSVVQVRMGEDAVNFPTADRNLTSIAFANIAGTERLVGINSSEYPYSEGSIVYIDHLTPENEAAFAITDSEIIPGGLGITGKLSIAETAKTTSFALPSANNDGRIYLRHVAQTTNSEIGANDSLSFVTLPGIAAEEGGLHFISNANFSPCGGRFLFACDYNSQACAVLDRTGTEAADGSWTETIPLHSGPSSAAVWTKAGLIFMDGHEIKLKPYQNGHLGSMTCQ